MKPFLILGSANCLFEDLRALDELVGGDHRGLFTVVAVNQAGWGYPHEIDHWVTLHPALLLASGPDWLTMRRVRGYPDGFRLWTESSTPGFDRVHVPWKGCGSGLYGVQVPLEKLGLAEGRGVLCGMPVDGRPHFHSKGKGWTAAGNFQKKWAHHAPKFRDVLRSMNGWTRDELLGAATADWLGLTTNMEA